MTDKHVEIIAGQATPRHSFHGHQLCGTIWKDITKEGFEGCLPFFGGNSRSADAFESLFSTAIAEMKPDTDETVKGKSWKYIEMLLPFADLFPWLSHLVTLDMLTMMRGLLQIFQGASRLSIYTSAHIRHGVHQERGDASIAHAPLLRLHWVSCLVSSLVSPPTFRSPNYTKNWKRPSRNTISTYPRRDPMRKRQPTLQTFPWHPSDA